jgi:hypothetical protein
MSSKSKNMKLTRRVALMKEDVLKTLDTKFRGKFHSKYLDVVCKLWLKCIPDVRMCGLEEPWAVYGLMLTRQ